MVKTLHKSIFTVHYYMYFYQVGTTTTQPATLCILSPHLPSTHMLKALHALLIGALISAFIACRGDSDSKQIINFGSERYDSTALHLAIMTDKDCLPILYAKRTGIYDSLGLKLQIVVYSSQADCDTALLGQYADGGMADLTRMESYGKRAAGLQSMWQGTDRRSMYVSNALRVKDIKALKGRTVGISPRTADELTLNEALQSASLKEGDIYRPQIANLQLRVNMLSGNQIDATILTWPYTSQAQADGNRCLYTQKSSDRKASFVMKAARLKKKSIAQQWKLLEQGRHMALDSLQSPRARQALSAILQKDYGISQQVADTLKLPY